MLTLIDYNYGNVIFLFSFLLAELPSQLVSKKLGPDRWIPIQISLWSIVAMSQCALTGKKGFFATRSILGLLEGGFIPDIVLWLSYFYTSRELPTRLRLVYSVQSNRFYSLTHTASSGLRFLQPRLSLPSSPSPFFTCAVLRVGRVGAGFFLSRY